VDTNARVNRGEGVAHIKPVKAGPKGEKPIAGFYLTLGLAAQRGPGREREAAVARWNPQRRRRGEKERKKKRDEESSMHRIKSIEKRRSFALRKRPHAGGKEHRNSSMRGVNVKEANGSEGEDSGGAPPENGRRTEISSAPTSAEGDFSRILGRDMS